MAFEGILDGLRFARFFLWATIIAMDDLLFKGRRRFNWKARLTELVQAPASGVTKGWAVVTGANSGIGLHTAMQLAESGINVVLACRSRERGEAARLDVEKAGKKSGAKAELVLCDVADLTSVKRCVGELAERGMDVSLLVCNAGVMVTPWDTTPQGYEVQVGTHLVGHALLTELIIDRHRRRSGSPRLRVVVVGSAFAWGGRWSPEVFSKSEPACYNRFQRYSDAKTAQLLFYYKLAERLALSSLGPPSVTVNVVHPGCPRTNVQRHLPGASHWGHLVDFSPFNVAPEEAALYVLRLCTASDFDNTTGVYYHTNQKYHTDPVTYDAKAREECYKLTQEAVSPFLTKEQQGLFA
eukprot:Hpha_TRINITY_DN16170_c0_g2::TRINITY_DN16170_c0_g2_i1::g.8665::m.8665